MSRKIFSSILITTAVSIIAVCFFIIGVLYSDFTADIQKQLKNEAVLVKTAMDSTGEEYLANVGKKCNNRITLVDATGVVLYDNYANKLELDNHLNRPEIDSAAKTGHGTATRLSDTLGRKTMYYAIKLENETILRMAVTTDSVIGIMRGGMFWIILIIVCIFVLAAIIAKMLTRAIVTPINMLNLDTPLHNDTYSELSPLLMRMDKQNKEIKEQINLVCKKQNELIYITEHMTEGLVVFSSDKSVILENESARELFGAKSQHEHYLELSRDLGYIQAMNTAFSGQAASTKITVGESIYQLSCTPINNDMSGFGVVVFIMDITNQEEAEQLRKEFTANVSHELKTPLTSILGRAEIMSTGIAKPEDMQFFAHQIFEEAKRLRVLIDDIIHLSQLDECTLKDEFRDVDLDKICKETVAALSCIADANEVTLEYNGEPVHIMGIESSLREIAYNLCENAIHYNKAGGKVIVNLSKNGDKTLLVVEDTGIGIPKEQQSRIFERFYCVDKSRSKNSGGTGLGLSIVKHSVKIHNGTISVESTPNVGTRIAVEL